MSLATFSCSELSTLSVLSELAPARLQSRDTIKEKEWKLSLLDSLVIHWNESRLVDSIVNMLLKFDMVNFQQILSLCV